MAGLFEARTQHLVVSNMRFYALMEWAIDVASGIDDSKGPLHISKMQRGYKENYSLVTYLDLDGELDYAEQVFWSEAFAVVGDQLFHRTIGTTDDDSWRPSAIADAVILSRMLRDLSRV